MPISDIRILLMNDKTDREKNGSENLFIYMPHVKFQDPSIYGSWFSQLPKSVTDGQTDGQTGPNQKNLDFGQ